MMLACQNSQLVTLAAIIKTYYCNSSGLLQMLLRNNVSSKEVLYFKHINNKH